MKVNMCHGINVDQHNKSKLFFKNINQNVLQQLELEAVLYQSPTVLSDRQCS